MTDPIRRGARARAVRETVTVLVEMRISYEDRPGARGNAIRAALEMPNDLSGASVIHGGYSVRRGPTRLAPTPP